MFHQYIQRPIQGRDVHGQMGSPLRIVKIPFDGMLHINQQAMGAFAVAEQLGLSLGIKEIVALAFPVVHEKTMHQLLLQEYMLEMAPISILYKQNT
ncbi:hypothetical protein V7077_11905 [Neobacillus vireti]